MPQFNIQYERKDLQGRRLPAPSGLVTSGPVIPVEAKVPAKLAEALERQSMSIPNPVSGMALIDTGATKTCVDQSVIDALQLPVTGVMKIGSASGPCEATVHAVELLFPTLRNAAVILTQALSCNMSGQKHGAKQITVLFGRDLLSRFVMIYNGPNAAVNLILG